MTTTDPATMAIAPPVPAVLLLNLQSNTWAVDLIDFRGYRTNSEPHTAPPDCAEVQFTKIEVEKVAFDPIRATAPP